MQLCSLKREIALNFIFLDLHLVSFLQKEDDSSMEADKRQT